MHQRGSLAFARGRRHRTLAAATLLAALAVPATAQPAPREWHGIVRLGGTPVGGLHEEITLEPDGTVRTRSTSAMAIGRAGKKVEMSGTSDTVESATGELLLVTADVRMSQQTQRVVATREAGGLRVASSSGGAGAIPQERLLPVTGALIGPEGLRRRTVTELREIGDTLSASTFVAELAGIFAFERRLLSLPAVEPGAEAAAPVRVVEERWTGLPIVRTLRFDAAGMLVGQSEPGPFGEMEFLRTGREEAELAAAGGELPPELYERTLVRSNVRVPSARALDRLLLRLTLDDDRLGWPQLESTTQRIVARNGNSLDLEITRLSPPVNRPDAPRAAEPALIYADREPAVFASDSAYLAANPIIESADPEVVRLAREIVGGEADPYRQALLLTEWVHRNMQFDLGILMAPASELVRDRRGTCAGYATLLAALARAAGIPSRYLLGYVYYLGIWGGHAWVEMRIGDRWVPFDAAVFAPGPADAGHLAVARDSLQEGVGMVSLAGIQVYGRLRIEVLEMRVAGQDLRVPPAPPVRVDGGTWSSPGLGVALRAPAGFRFTVTDAVWPDSTLVALEGPQGVRISLREESRFPERSDADAARARLNGRGFPSAPVTRAAAGRTAYWVSGPDRAAVAWVDGTQVLTLVVEGPRAQRALDRLVARGVAFGGPPLRWAEADGRR